MSDPVAIAIITGLSMAVPTIITSVINRRHVSEKLAEYHLQVNSRLDQLMKAEKGVSHAEGMEAQKQAERETQHGTTL